MLFFFNQRKKMVYVVTQKKMYERMLSPDWCYKNKSFRTSFEFEFNKKSRKKQNKLKEQIKKVIVFTETVIQKEFQTIYTHAFSVQ